MLLPRKERNGLIHRLQTHDKNGHMHMHMSITIIMRPVYFVMVSASCLMK